MLICGVDEAGRGPLAGPVVAAAVILPNTDFPTEKLKDSKALSDKDRRSLSAVLREKSWWSVGEASPEEIDAFNILQATLLAMKRAIEGLPVVPAKVLVDGLFVPKVAISCESIVHGDATVPEIMAASILAKTYRDDLMIQWAWIYPQYGFERHKGYPTKAHREALKKWGPSPIHRKSFRLVYVS